MPGVPRHATVGADGELGPGPATDLSQLGRTLAPLPGVAEAADRGAGNGAARRRPRAGTLNGRRRRAIGLALDGGHLRMTDGGATSVPVMSGRTPRIESSRSRNSSVTFSASSPLRISCDADPNHDICSRKIPQTKIGGRFHACSGR